MIRKLIVVILVVVFCVISVNGNTKTNKQAVKKTKAEKNSVLTVDDFVLKAKEYVGKEVIISGMVVHICKESGKKLFLGGKNPKNKVKITAGDSMPKFDVKLEGDILQVKGKVKELRIDEAYLDLQEKNINNVSKSNKINNKKDKKEHFDEEPKADNHRKKEDALKQVQSLREKVKASKEGYISFFSVELITLKKVADKVDVKVKGKNINSSK